MDHALVAGLMKLPARRWRSRMFWGWLTVAFLAFPDALFFVALPFLVAYGEYLGWKERKESAR